MVEQEVPKEVVEVPRAYPDYQQRPQPPSEKPSVAEAEQAGCLLAASCWTLTTVLALKIRGMLQVEAQRNSPRISVTQVKTAHPKFLANSAAVNGKLQIERIFILTMQPLESGHFG